MASYWETLAGSVAQNDGSQGLATALGAMNDYVQNVKARGDTLTQGFKDLGTGMKSAFDTAQDTVDSISENDDKILNNQIQASALEQVKDNQYYGYLDANIESKHIDNAWKQKKDNLESMRASLGVPNGNSQDLYNTANSLISQYNYAGSGLTNSDIEFYLKNPAALQVAIEKGNLKNNAPAQEIIMKAASDSAINRYLKDADRLYLAEQEIEQGVLTPGEWRNVADNIYNDPSYNNRPGNSAQDIYASLMIQQNGLTGQKGTFADFQQALRSQRYVNNNVNGIHNILNMQPKNGDGASGGGGNNGGNGIRNPNAAGNAGAVTAVTPNNAQQQPNAADTAQQATDESNNSQQLSELALADIKSAIDSMSDDAFNLLFGGKTREQVYQDFVANGKNSDAAKRVERIYGSDYFTNINSSNKQVVDELGRVAHESNSDMMKFFGTGSSLLAGFAVDYLIGKGTAAIFKGGGISGNIAIGSLPLIGSLFGSGEGPFTNPDIAKQMSNMPSANPINAAEYSQIAELDRQIGDIENQIKRPADQWVNPDGTSMTPAQKDAEINRLNNQKDLLTQEKNTHREIINSRQKQIDDIINDKKLTNNEKIDKIEKMLNEQATKTDEFNEKQNLSNRRKIKDETRRINDERRRIGNIIDRNLNTQINLIEDNKRRGLISADEALWQKDNAKSAANKQKLDIQNKFDKELELFKKSHPTNLPTNTAEEAKKAFGDFRHKVQRAANAKAAELEKARDAAMAAEKDPVKKNAIKKAYDGTISKVKNAPKWMLKQAKSHPIITGLSLTAVVGGFAIDNALDNSLSNFVKDELGGFFDANLGIGKVSSAIAANTAYANEEMTEEEWEKSILETGPLSVDDKPNYWVDRGETLGQDIGLALRDAYNIFARYTPLPDIDAKSPSWETYVKGHNAALRDIQVKRGIASINDSIKNNLPDNPNDFENLLEQRSPATQDAEQQSRDLTVELKNAAANNDLDAVANIRKELNKAESILSSTSTADMNQSIHTINIRFGGSANTKPGELNSIAKAVIPGIFGKPRNDSNITIFSGTNSPKKLIPQRNETTGKSAVNIDEAAMIDVYGKDNTADFLNKTNAASNGGLAVQIADLTSVLDMSQHQNIAVVDAFVNDPEISKALGVYRKEMEAIESGKSKKNVKDVQIAYDEVIIRRTAQIIVDINKLVENGGGKYKIGNKEIEIQGYGNFVSAINGGDVGSVLLAAFLQQDKFRSTPSADSTLTRAAEALKNGDVKQFVSDYMASHKYNGNNKVGSAHRTNEFFKLRKLHKNGKINNEQYIARFMSL